MIYRDELAAAVARADALQREVEELRLQADADKDRIYALRKQLDDARIKLQALQDRLAPERPPSRRAPLLGAAVVIFICSVAGAFMSRTQKARPRLPPTFAESPVVLAAPRAATLAVKSDPPGARVVLDGAAVGETPALLDVAPGAHHVKVTLGDRVQERRVVVNDLASVAIDFDEGSP